MPGLVDATTGFAQDVGTGLIWLPGGLGGPGEIITPVGYAIFDRFGIEVFDRAGNPIQARVETFSHTFTIYDRTGAGVLDRATNDILTRA